MIKNLSSSVYFIGIGGISMSALAQILKAKGHTVAGSDASKSKQTEKLKKEKIKVFIGHRAENILGYETVVYNSAIKESNPELAIARALGKIVLTRAELLAKIENEYKLKIAISGSHGKTTSSAWLASAMMALNLSPTIHLGGEAVNLNSNFVVGKSNIFLTEACEYMDNFLALSPSLGAILNIQADHLDYFKNFNRIKKSFAKFAKNCKKVVINLDDPTCRKIMEADKNKDKFITFSICDSRADYFAENILLSDNKKPTFNLYVSGKCFGRIELPIYLEHNVQNYLAVFALLYEVYPDAEAVAQKLSLYLGVRRRFEEKGRLNGALVVHDYAHHPTEIEKVIEEAENVFGKKPIVVFEPHTYTRTQALMWEFARAFSKAEKVFIYKIYPAREPPIKGITGLALAQKVNNASLVPATSVENEKELKKVLAKTLTNKDVLLCLGAGNIDVITEKLLTK